MKKMFLRVCSSVQLSQDLGFPLYPKSNLTFSKCLEMGLQDYIEPIAKVAEVAGKEYSIEQVRRHSDLPLLSKYRKFQYPSAISRPFST